MESEVDHLLPTPERIKRGAELIPQAIADDEGRPSQPYRDIDLLAGMERRGRITAEMRQGGEDFRRAFHRAQFDTLKSSDPARPFITGGRREASEGSAKARESVARALDVLGGRTSQAGSIVWHVIGLEMTIKEWAMMYSASHGAVISGQDINEISAGRPGPSAGRPKCSVSEPSAAGILIGALCPLARFYGHETSS